MSTGAVRQTSYSYLKAYFILNDIFRAHNNASITHTDFTVYKILNFLKTF
jgi:hypothetical protein